MRQSNYAPPSTLRLEMILGSVATLLLSPLMWKGRPIDLGSLSRVAGCTQLLDSLTGGQGVGVGWGQGPAAGRAALRGTGAAPAPDVRTGQSSARCCGGWSGCWDGRGSTRRSMPHCCHGSSGCGGAQDQGPAAGRTAAPGSRRSASAGGSHSSVQRSGLLVPAQHRRDAIVQSLRLTASNKEYRSRLSKRPPRCSLCGALLPNRPGGARCNYGRLPDADVEVDVRSD